MSITGIASNILSSSYGAQSPQNQFQQVQNEFQQLGQALQSGNLSQAQSDFATLSQNVPGLGGSTASASTTAASNTATTNAANTNPIAQAFAQLGQDLQSGNLTEEIVPVNIPGPKGSVKTVSDDEHIRPDTTIEALAKLPTPFRQNGTVTAGNASGVNDGACAMFVASEEAAAKFGLKPLARVLGSATAGVLPDYMGIGPIYAVRKLLARLKMSLDDVNVFELNEAFASQALAVTRELGLPDDSEKVNPNGGAIAIGHPLGMSGARLVLTATRQIQRIKGRYALASMCIGVGQGIAIMLERV